MLWYLFGQGIQALKGFEILSILDVFFSNRVTQSSSYIVPDQVHWSYKFYCNEVMFSNPVTNIH